MRKAIWLSAALSVGAVGAIFVGMSPALARTGHHAATGPDLAMTGSVVAGVTSGQVGLRVPFTFTMTNKSSTTSASVAFIFTLTNGTADISSYVCPLTTTHFD